MLNTEKYPAAYREMQNAFSQTFARLQLAAEPGLAAYTHQTEVNPDFPGWWQGNLPPHDLP